MEHLVQIGVVVEDEAVQKSVVNALRDKLYDQIKDAVLSSERHCGSVHIFAGRIVRRR